MAGTCNFQDPDYAFGKGAQYFCCSDSGLGPSEPEVCGGSKYLSVMWLSARPNEGNLSPNFKFGISARLRVFASPCDATVNHGLPGVLTLLSEAPRGVFSGAEQCGYIEGLCCAVLGWL